MFKQLDKTKSFFLWDSLKKYKDFGILIIRIGIGFDFLVFHGWSKLMGGPRNWISLGAEMPGFEIDGIYMFWGLMASLAETVGAIFLAIGLFFRPMAALLAITMIVAVYVHFHQDDPWWAASHAQKMALICLGLMFVGPGKFSIDHRWLR